jgi:hypothetical protein
LCAISSRSIPISKSTDHITDRKGHSNVNSLIKVITDSSAQPSLADLVPAVTATLAQMAQAPALVETMNAANAIEILVPLLDNGDGQIQAGAADALWSLLYFSERSRGNFRSCGGVDVALRMLTSQNFDLLANILGMLWAAVQVCILQYILYFLQYVLYRHAVGHRAGKPPGAIGSTVCIIL